MEDTHACRACKAVLPVTVFPWRSNKRTREWECRPCRSKRYLPYKRRPEVRAKLNAITKRWIAAHPEYKAKQKARRREWDKKNPQNQRPSRIAWLTKKKSQLRAYHRAWHLANRERIRMRNEERRDEIRAWRKSYNTRKAAYMFEYRLRRHYGIEQRDFDKLVRKQKGACAICKRPETTLQNGKFRGLCVDHHHVSKQVRGLLCVRCNAGLGSFLDDPTLLIAAARYLRRCKRLHVAA